MEHPRTVFSATDYRDPLPLVEVRALRQEAECKYEAHSARVEFCRYHDLDYDNILTYYDVILQFEDLWFDRST